MPKRKKIRSSTSHLKIVPETLELRELVKAKAQQFAEKLDHSKPFNKAQLTVWANQLLGEMSLPEKYSGFAAVMIGNFFWRRQFLATPFERQDSSLLRLLAQSQALVVRPPHAPAAAAGSPVPAIRLDEGLL